MGFKSINSNIIIRSLRYCRNILDSYTIVNRITNFNCLFKELTSHIIIDNMSKIIFQAQYIINLEDEINSKSFKSIIKFFILEDNKNI